MERTPTISEIIDQRSMSRYQIWTMALCGTVIVLDGFDTQSIGFLAPSMAESLHIPIKNFGPIFVFALIGLNLLARGRGCVTSAGRRLTGCSEVRQRARETGDVFTRWNVRG